MRLDLNSHARKGMCIALGLVIVSGGCKSDNSEPPKTDRSSMQEFFPAHETRQIHKFAVVQTRNEARADSTLMPYHFDGAQLNGRGRDKLDVIVDSNPEALNTIYLNFPESDMMDQRREAVRVYSLSLGVQENNLKFVSGPNPARTSPSAGHLARIGRSESAGSGLADDGSDGFVPTGMTGSAGGAK